MKRLIGKEASYNAKGELERIIGYLVTRRSGLRLDKHHFEKIIEHFHQSGGELKGLQGKVKENHWPKLHKAIDHVLRTEKLKK